MSQRIIRTICRLASCAAALAASAPALAGSLQVDPIRLEINAGRRTATLRVRNQDQAPVTIRAYPLAWSQVDGEDRYEESSAVIVSPPIFTIPAGGSQLIRIGLRRPSRDARAYRLIVEEVPQASPDGGIQVALRLNLPLFAMMDSGDASQLSWAASRASDGGWTLEATNRGATYVRVDPAAAEAATGIDLDSNTNFGVVLPGSSRRWAIGARPAMVDQGRFNSIQRANGGAQAQLQTGGE